MENVQTILRESKVYYDKDGECWILLHVPEEVDVGDMGMTLWRDYVKYLEMLRADELSCEEPCLV